MFSAILHHYETFSLSELDSNDLLMSNRFESKYFFHLSQVDTILEACKKNYKLLNIDDRRIFDYQNCYFDTADFQLFFSHHKGKPSRVKIRKRVYQNSNLSFLEVKQKTSKGTTNKFREISDRIENSADFILNHSGMDLKDLHPAINNQYKRMTFLHKERLEKVTIDINLNFDMFGKKAGFDNLAIAEVKTEKNSGSEFCSIMKSIGLREGGLSKYCLGVISLNPDIKHNNFKAMYKQIKKKNTNESK